jgi:hypothetical protein
LNFLHSLLPLFSLAQIFSLASYSQTLKAYVPSSIWATKFHTHTQQAKLHFTRARRVLSLRMDERSLIWKVAANVLNMISRTDNKGWSSSVGFWRGANSSSQ